MTLRIAGIIEESIVDGPGLRLVVFAQGCSHHCPGCHNPETHDYSGGREIEVKKIIETMRANPLLDGLSLSGGEPFDQALPFAELSREAHKYHYNVMAWSGYTFEELIKNPERREFLENVDILIDGLFEIKQRSLNLLWRGSKNQRILDVPVSLSSGHAVSKKI